MSGNTIYVKETSGNTVKVKLSSATKISKSESVPRKKLYPGDQVVIAGSCGLQRDVHATSVTDSGASSTGSAAPPPSSSTGSTRNRFGDQLAVRRRLIRNRTPELKGLTETMRSTRRSHRGGVVGSRGAACGRLASPPAAARATRARRPRARTPPPLQPVSSGASANRTAFTTCLKQHGVTLPKRPGPRRLRLRGTGTRPAAPQPTGDDHHPERNRSGRRAERRRRRRGGAGPIGGGFAGGNSKFAKAFQACRSKLPAGSFGQGRFGRAASAAARARRHPALLDGGAEVIRRLHPQRTAIRRCRSPSSIEQQAVLPGERRATPSSSGQREVRRVILLHAFRGIAPGRSTDHHRHDVDHVEHLTGLQ